MQLYSDLNFFKHSVKKKEATSYCKHYLIMIADALTVIIHCLVFSGCWLSRCK